MGTFLGHAVPGTFFIIMSVWWTIAINFRYSRSHRSNSRFRSTLTYPCGRITKIPLESFVKFSLSMIGVAGETATGFDSTGAFTLMNAQHITMFSFFGLQALLEIFTFYNAPLPPYVDYASTVLAFAMQGLLFAYHLHGRTPLDVMVHTLLIYVIFSCVVSVALEAAWRNNVLFPLTRCYFILLQGTWFYQVGFILYPPFAGMAQWDAHNHKQMMLVIMMFTWHCAVDFIIILALSAMVNVRHRNQMHSGAVKLSLNSLLPHKKDPQQNHKTKLLNDTDSESEGA